MLSVVTKRYDTIEKSVGETPLQAIERYRIHAGLDARTPLAYAGRLDPMASGKLLVLIGDECKFQKRYHGYDKEYHVDILLGIGSDTGDVLGIVQCDQQVASYSMRQLNEALTALHGTINLPYPHFSSRTVRGKPLHTWTLEGRLNEITIPDKESQIYKLTFVRTYSMMSYDLLNRVMNKIETIPPVTEQRKALGADFRRLDVRAAWKSVYDETPHTMFQLVSCVCIASSGTYMRSLTEEVGKRLGARALAYSIHRTRIGRYIPIIPNMFGLWARSY